MKSEIANTKKYSPSSIEKFLGKESPFKEFQYYTNQGVAMALNHVDATYGDNGLTSPKGKERQNRLFYHSRWHTEGVINRATTIMKTIQAADPGQVSQRDYELVRLAAAFHDTEQISTVDPNQKPDASGRTPKKRIRATGDNERLSAENAKKLYEKS